MKKAWAVVCAGFRGAVVVALAFTLSAGAFGQTKAEAKPKAGPVDPGVRDGAAGVGGPLKGLTADETAFFVDGMARFAEVESVTKGANNGLGPRFNSNQCLSCHSQPEAGGSSPAENPLLAVATLNGAKNKVPWFITAKGPVREARFKHSPDGTGDGEVHDLFVINGGADAVGCNIAQPGFLAVWDPLTGEGGNSAAMRMTERFRGLGGRHRTSRCCYLRARRTTWRWA